MPCKPFPKELLAEFEAKAKLVDPEAGGPRGPPQRLYPSDQTIKKM